MSDQRFAIDEIELRQSCQQVFAVPVVTVGNVVKVFRSVNMQTTACGVHGVMVNGVMVYEDRQFNFDCDSIYAQARKAAASMWRRMDALA